MTGGGSRHAKRPTALTKNEVVYLFADRTLKDQKDANDPATEEDAVDPVELEVVPTSDGLLAFEVVGGTVLRTERAEFLMTYEDAAALNDRLGELLASKP